MEFNFNINNYFKEEITKIDSRLIPDGFIGDRREVQDCLSKVSYILNILGEKSANAQGLQKVITSGEKLRNSDHVVYIIIDPKAGSKGLGTVLGMLKVGVKHLYVFDAGGKTHEVTTKCILDFYVHESKQRMGLGKKLFQHMLKEERVDPVHLAIDKPSSKFLSFLVKHYGLKTIIPQMNNFVVFDGFFSNRSFGGGLKDKPGSNSCGNLYPSGSSGLESSFITSSHRFQSPSAINLTNNNVSYYGRQAPHKPISTMGMILQQKPANSQQPTQSGSSAPEEKNEEVEEKPSETAEPEEVVTKEEENAEEPILPPVQSEEGSQRKDSVDGKPDASPLVSPLEECKSSKEVFRTEPKSRLNSQGHLDLKFYHSSLW